MTAARSDTAVTGARRVIRNRYNAGMQIMSPTNNNRMGSSSLYRTINRVNFYRR